MDRITEIDKEIAKLQAEKATIEQEANDWEEKENDCPCEIKANYVGCDCVCHEGYQVKHSLIVISVRQMVENAIISSRTITDK